LLISEQDVEECDATEGDSGNKADNIIKAPRRLLPLFATRKKK